MDRISQAKIKFVQSLKRKKYRIKYGSYVLEGRKACETVIESGVYPQLQICLDTGEGQITQKAAETLYTDEKSMKAMSSFQSIADIMCVFNIPEKHSVESIESDSVILAVDQIQDPGNLGSIIRTADWFGITSLIMFPGTVDVYNPKTLQASMGSHAAVRILHLQTHELRDAVPNALILGLDMNGTSIQNFRKTDDTTKVLVIGNEGHGLSPSSISILDKTVSIPGHPHRKAESLNAALATAIAISQFKL